MVLMMGMDSATSRKKRKATKRMTEVAIERARCRSKGLAIARGGDFSELGTKTVLDMVKYYYRTNE